MLFDAESRYSNWPASHPAYFNPRSQRPPPQLDGTPSLFGRDVEKKKKCQIKSKVDSPVVQPTT